MPTRYPIANAPADDYGRRDADRCLGLRARQSLRKSKRPALLKVVLLNWAALVALWALPYLTLLEHVHPEAARSELLQWLLLIVGIAGMVSILVAAWRGGGVARRRPPALRGGMGRIKPKHVA